MNNLLEYALKYAELGWKIIPIKPRQKVPLTKHGVKDATDHPDVIRAWWENWPNANIAVALGEPSGVYVIDVDLDNDKGISGYKSLKEFPQLPVTVQQMTPRGGFHAFFRASDPPVNKNCFRPGIDIRGDGYYVLLAPSIHPNGGVYRWIKGYGPGEFHPAEFPDFMRPVIGAQAANAPSVAAVDFLVPRGPEADILKRASLYLSECDPAIQGQAGHSSLLWAAVALVHGFLLTDNQAYTLLSGEYNLRCVPPWDFGIPTEDKDFRRKITEARKLIPQKPRGWLLEDANYKPVDPAQVEAVVEMVKKAEAKKSTGEAIVGRLQRFTADQQNEIARLSKSGQHGIGYWIQKGGVSIDKELEFLIRPPGLLGDICHWINDTAMMPQPFLTLACSIAFLGTLFGRKVRDKYDSRTNFYCFGIADSSAGKNHAPKQIRKLCQEAGCLDLLGGIGTTGDAAIESRLEKYPSCLFFWDEIGFLFAKASSGTDGNQRSLIPYLMQLYSAAAAVFLGREYADIEKRRTIVQPCCSIYGTSAPVRFMPSLTQEQISDGFLARCLIFRGAIDPKIERYDCVARIPKEILEVVVKWRDRVVGETDGTNIGAFASYYGALGKAFVKPPEQILIECTTEAEKVFVDFYDACHHHAKENGHLGNLWRKGEENARKVALVIASGCNFQNPEITVSMADYSCRLIRYLLKDFMENIAPMISSGVIDEQKQKIINIINETEVKGCTGRTITRTARWSTQNQRKALLSDLLEGEEIVMSAEGKVIRYWTAENYASKLLKEKKTSND